MVGDAATIPVLGGDCGTAGRAGACNALTTAVTGGGWVAALESIVVPIASRYSYLCTKEVIPVLVF